MVFFRMKTMLHCTSNSMHDAVQADCLLLCAFGCVGVWGEMSLRRIYAWTGDFGIDLVVLFKFNPADVSRIPEARIAVFLTTRLPRCLSQSSDYAGRRRRRNIDSSVF